MLRNTTAILTGYVIFVLSSLALFQFSGVDPHKQASMDFQMVTAVYGGFFSFIGGFVVQVIAKTRKLVLNYILALVIAGFAALSLIKAGGIYWTQLLAIIVFAPVSFCGGFFYVARKMKQK